MKRSLLILVATAAVWTGCSKTETIDQPQGMAIGFTNAYIGNPVESKAVGIIEQDSIDEFIVYGGYNDMTHVFDAVSVTGDANTDNWSYTTTRYWVAGKTYKFAAYAPKGINGTIETDFATGTLNFTNYVSDPSNQHDLIYDAAGPISTPDPIEAPRDKVQFGFSHLLSMIKFTFNSGFANDIKVTVDSLNVSGMVSQGNYIGSTGTWDPGSETVSTEAAFTEMDDNEAINKTTGNTSASSVDFAVIPQEIGDGTTVTVSFNVRVQDNLQNYIIGNEGAGVNVSATLPAYTWEKGNRYNYTVTIKGENVDLYPIEFGTPNVTEITNDVNFPASDEVILPTN